MNGLGLIEKLMNFVLNTPNICICRYIKKNIEMDSQKAAYLQFKFTKTIADIQPETQPHWGKMNLQQMVEHLSRDAFRVASGKISFPLMMPAEHIPKMQEFIRSDKPFKENTVNRLMAEEPLPTIHSNIEAALTELQVEIDYFFDVYAKQPDLKLINPFFGELDLELQIDLLYKHALHHLRQFGVVV